MNPVLSVEKSIPMLDLGLQYSSIRTEIKAAIDQVLDSQHFILGPQVKALEEEVARYCGRRFGVGVASGTDALTLALQGLRDRARRRGDRSVFQFHRNRRFASACWVRPRCLSTLSRKRFASLPSN